VESSDAIADGASDKPRISSSTFTDEQSIPVGTPGDGLWDTSSFDKFGWQEGTVQSESAVLSSINTTTVVSNESVELNSLGISVETSSLSLGDSEKFTDLLWDNGDFNIRAWQRSPPHTPYVEVAARRYVC
jgi:hypothetical protein